MTGQNFSNEKIFIGEDEFGYKHFLQKDEEGWHTVILEPKAELERISINIDVK